MTAQWNPPIPRQQECLEKLRIAEVILLHQRSINEEVGYVREVQRIDRTLSRIRRELARLGYSADDECDQERE
jgi:hypothetical protein